MTRTRRLAASVALLASAGLAILLVFTAVQSFPQGLLAALGLVLAGFAGTQGLRRRRTARITLLAVAAILAVGSLVLLVAEGLLLEIAVAVVLVAVMALAGRRAFEPVPQLQAVDPPRHPVVIWNPKSGGGKALSNNLAAEAAARGIEAIELQRGDDIVQLVNDAVARGADALAAAGGDGTQALVATIAAERDLPFACIPAGTRNHFALDLGVDRDDVVGALDALVNGLERRVDLAEINGRVFVNNVSLGVYASAVQRDEYRDAKISTLLDTVPDVIGTTSTAASELRWVSPDGTTHGSTAVLLVSNNPYRIGNTHRIRNPPEARRRGARHRRHPGPGKQATASAVPPVVGMAAVPTFTVESDQPVPVGVDGEALVMEPPLEFRIRPRAFRVRIAPQHPGASPSSGAPTGIRDAFSRLAQIASAHHRRRPSRARQIRGPCSRASQPDASLRGRIAGTPGRKMRRQPTSSTEEPTWASTRVREKRNKDHRQTSNRGPISGQARPKPRHLEVRQKEYEASYEAAR